VGDNGAASAILLDFGGTLDADGIHWCPRFHDAYRTLGGALDYATFEAHFKTSEAMLAELPGIRTLGFRAAIDAQVRLLVGLLPHAAAVPGEQLALRLHDAALAMVRRNRPVLERLAARYRLGVVSNFTGNLEPCLAELGLLTLFAAVLDSGVLGISKPDERIFVRALAGVGARADETWMVGDNLEADIRPAQRLGLRTCWLAPPDRAGPADFSPTARIARLTELERAVT
jgi:putative hydrolase of the HAD superfamily